MMAMHIIVVESTPLALQQLERQILQTGRDCRIQQ